MSVPVHALALWATAINAATCVRAIRPAPQAVVGGGVATIVVQRPSYLERCISPLGLD